MVEIKKFGNLENLEFELLEEVKIEGDKEIDEGINDLINKIFDYNLNLIEIVGIKDDKKIGFNEKYYLIKSENVLEVGDFVLIKTYPKDCFWKVNQEILDKEYLKKYSEKIDYKIEIEDDFEGIIDKKYIKGHKQKQIKEKKEEEKERKEEEKKRLGEDEETNKEREIYEKESIGKFKGGEIEINKNEIFTYPKLKYILEKNVNEFFKFEDIYSMSSYWRISFTYSYLENKFIEKKINYIKEKINNNISVKIYDVEFGDEIKVSGVKILKNKLNFILNRINENTTEEQIKLLNKLTGMKFDILNLKEIKVDNFEIEININLVDDNNFKIEFINKKKIVDWNFIRKYFFSNGSSRSVRSNFWEENFIKFSSDFGLTKQELFDYLKRLKMLKNLESENES